MVEASDRHPQVAEILPEFVFQCAVEAVIEQDNLRLALLRWMLPNHQVARVRVAVYKSVREDHLGKHVNQNSRSLERAILSELFLQPVNVVNPLALDKLHHHRAMAALERILPSLWHVQIIVPSEVVARSLEVGELSLEVQLLHQAFLEMHIQSSEVDGFVFTIQSDPITHVNQSLKHK